MVWDAVASAMPKVAGSRLVCMTSAGDPAHWSYGVLTHAKKSRAWRVHEVPGPTPWIDPAALEDQRALLPESSYRRLHLNEWTAAEDRLVSVDALWDCVSLDGPLRPEHGQRYVVAVDVGLKKDRTVAAVCHAEPLDDSTRWRPPRAETSRRTAAPPTLTWCRSPPGTAGVTLLGGGNGRNHRGIAPRLGESITVAVALCSTECRSGKETGRPRCASVRWRRGYCKRPSRSGPRRSSTPTKRWG
jgi:hypothetical protein